MELSDISSSDLNTAATLKNQRQERRYFKKEKFYNKKKIHNLCKALREIKK